QQETGSQERTSIPGGPRKMIREQEANLLAWLKAEPHATVLEHCAWWAEHQAQPVSETTMWRAMRRLGWTQKKALAASERDEAARAAWREAVAPLDPQRLVLVDESGTHTALTRLYGWAPHDQRATGVVPRNHGKNTTLVAALIPDGLQAPWTVEG